MGSRVRMLLVAAVTAVALFTPMQDQVAAQSGPGIVISEFRFSGPAGVSDEFVELFNAGATPVNVTNWVIRASNNTRPPVVATRATIATVPPTTITINPGCYLLLANSSFYSGTVAADLTFPVGFADDGGVAVLTNTGTMVD